MSSKIRTIKKAINFRLLSQIFMKKFSFPKNIVRADCFSSGSFAVFIGAASPRSLTISSFSLGQFKYEFNLLKIYKKRKGL